jgi:hypothetical protein
MPVIGPGLATVTLRVPLPVLALTTFLLAVLSAVGTP